MKLIVFADGGCRKSGESVAGSAIFDINGNELSALSVALGKGTNNTAEYSSAIIGLSKAKELGAKEIQLIMDSQLVVKSLAGEYTVGKEHLKPLYAQAMGLLKSFEKYHLTHVFRRFNSRADELANLAYKEQKK
jgi:ribonuclease HI